MTLKEFMTRLNEIAYRLPVGEDEKVQVYVQCETAGIDNHIYGDDSVALKHADNEQPIVRITGSLGA